MFSSQHIAKISVTENDFTYFCSLPYIIIEYVYIMGWLRNKLKRLHVDKQYQRIVPLKLQAFSGVCCMI